MSRHENVSCDSCMKANFKGRRYKCLICYDYDLCAACYEAGTTTVRHTIDHSMQCILTRTDFDMYYEGEGVSSEHPQSFSCPHCGEMGFTENSLCYHVQSRHNSSTNEVICPICAALPGGDPNYVSDDLLSHLQTDHRYRDALEQEPLSLLRHPIRSRQGAMRGRGARSTRHWTPASTQSSSGSNSNSTRLLPEAMDPIAELLSHLSGVQNRLRVNPQQIQLLSAADPDRLLREQLQSGMPHRMRASALPVFETITSNRTAESSNDNKTSSLVETNMVAGIDPNSLLYKFIEPKKSTGESLEQEETETAQNSLFTQELLLSTLLTQKLSTNNDKATNHPDEEKTEPQ